MKKIINGLRYDTDTAVCVHVLHSDLPAGHGKFHRTSLYRTTSGRWFIAGTACGGSMWGQELPDCNDSVSGKGLRVVHEVEAREILESENAIEELEEFF
mgnify:CR=1 FL=1|jgi:hypothetical protein